MLWQHRTVEARSRSGHLHRQQCQWRPTYRELCPAASPVYARLTAYDVLSVNQFCCLWYRHWSCRELTTWLWKYRAIRHLKTAHGPSTVRAQCRSETYLQPSQVRPRYSAAQELHWLRVPERIKFQLAVLMFKCRNKTAPQYLADDLHVPLPTAICSPPKEKCGLLPSHLWQLRSVTVAAVVAVGKKRTADLRICGCCLLKHSLFAA